MISTLPRCFVISPIGEPGGAERRRADEVLTHIIKRALSDRYEVVRSDSIEQPGSIKTSLLKHVVEDPLVVADLTGQNPNVFYELAVRHATRKPIIHISEDPPAALPFDVNDVRVIQFDRSLTGAADCVEAIRAYVSDDLSDEPVHSPISLTLDILNIGDVSSAQTEILTQVVDLRSSIAWLTTNIDLIRAALERPDPALEQMARSMFTFAEVFTEIGKQDANAAKIAEAYKLWGLALEARLATGSHGTLTVKPADGN